MRTIYSFPSVFEGSNANLNHVSNDLINGLKIYIDDNSYILGNLALSEGQSPRKSINTSPNETEYKLF